jgi:hypothetical protein
MHHLMHRGTSRAWLQWSSSTSKRFRASSALFFSSRRAVARMMSFQLSRAWQAWDVLAGSRLTALHKLRAAEAMFTRRDMVGAVRAWQSACRAAATLTHALSALMDPDLLCAGGTRCLSRPLVVPFMEGGRQGYGGMLCRATTRPSTVYGGMPVGLFGCPIIP